MAETRIKDAPTSVPLDPRHRKISVGAVDAGVAEVQARGIKPGQHIYVATRVAVELAPSDQRGRIGALALAGANEPQIQSQAAQPVPTL